MQQPANRYFLVILISFLIGAILTVLPLPSWIVWARPQWVFLILIFWTTMTPNKMSVGTAWLIGLFMDLLTGTLLGQHAFVYAFVAYFLIRFHPQMKNFPLSQQSLMIFVLVMLNLALQYWINGIAGTPVQHWVYWLPSISSVIIWPWLCLLLRESRWTRLSDSIVR